MSRYLTSSKIGLLALISLYVDSAVPTAFTVSVLSFIVSELLSFTNSNSMPISSSRQHCFTLSIDDFRTALMYFPSGIPGRSIWDLFLKELWQIDSVNSIHVFFDSLVSLLEAPVEALSRSEDSTAIPIRDRMRLSKTSPLGLFVRRSRLEFTRLQIHDVISLWKSFVAFRQPTFLKWRKRNPIRPNTISDANSMDSNYSQNDKIKEVLYGDPDGVLLGNTNFSTDDVGKIFEFQVDQLQSMFVCTKIIYITGANLSIIIRR